MRCVVALLSAALLLTSCVVTPKPKPFELEVLPAQEPVAVRTAIPGQRIAFLVRSPGQVIGDGSIEVRASVDGAAYELYDGFVETTAGAPAGGVSVELRAERVVEIVVIPDALHEWEEEGIVSVTVTGTRRGLSARATRTIPVVQGTDARGEDARRIRGLFLPWLVTKHPELGIDASTRWDGTIAGAHLLGVSHYTYFSDDWELGVSWHVMVARDDWATLYLRRRFAESTPSFAARIASVSQGAAPVEEPPPDGVRR